MTSIDEIASLFSMPTEEVQAKYDEVFARQPVDMVEEDRIERALNETRILLKREDRARKASRTFEGFICGGTEVRDFMDFMRRKARAYEEEHGREMAVMKGYVDRDGNILDTREKVFGKPNKHQGEKLDPKEKNYSRDIFAVLKQNGSDNNAKFTRVSFSRNLAPKVNYMSFRPCWFTAIPARKQPTTYYQVNASRYTKDFHEMADLSFAEGSMEKAIREYCRIVPLADLEQENERMGDADKERLCWTEGTVSKLKLEPNPKTGARIMFLEHGNRDGEVIAFLPNYVPIDFPEYSNVIVLGRLTKGKPREGESEGNIQLNVYGVYSKPSQRVAVPAIEERMEEQIAEEEEYFGTGWKGLE